MTRFAIFNNHVVNVDQIAHINLEDKIFSEGGEVPAISIYLIGDIKGNPTLQFFGDSLESAQETVLQILERGWF